MTPLARPKALEVLGRGFLERLAGGFVANMWRYLPQGWRLGTRRQKKKGFSAPSWMPLPIGLFLPHGCAQSLHNAACGVLVGVLGLQLCGEVAWTRGPCAAEP